MQVNSGTMQALSAESEHEFERRLVDALSPSFPQLLTMQKVELNKLIWTQVKRARAHGFLTEEDFGIYMIAQATGDKSLADSATTEVRRRTVDPAAVTDSTLRNTHPAPAGQRRKSA